MEIKLNYNEKPRGQSTIEDSHRKAYAVTGRKKRIQICQSVSQIKFLDPPLNGNINDKFTLLKKKKNYHILIL